MKHTLSLALGATLIASQAAALSCMQPDPARTFQQVAAAEERYVVFLGTFDFAAPPVQRGRLNAQPQQVTATFQGQGLGAGGFAPTAPVSITLQTSCSGPWCGNFPTRGAEVLTFVEQTDAGYVLTLDACGGLLFDPSAAPIVESCIRGEGCEENAVFR